MYSAYKPMRNFAAKLNRIDSLIKIWSFFGNLERGTPLPQQFTRVGKNGLASLKEIVHPWELDILTREIILHAQNERTKDLYNTDHLSAAINHIRRISETQNAANLERTLYQELQRLYQQQSLWRTNTHLMLARHFIIYSTPNLASFIERETSLSIKQYYILAMSISGNFLTKQIFNTQQDYTAFGISDEQRNAFMDKAVFEIDALRDRTAKTQEYNENWSYTINPLISTPLIAFNKNTPNLVICPIPFYLLYRFSEGLFFDITSIKGHEQAYGDAFEKYVYDVSNILNTNKKAGHTLEITKPKPYKIGKNEKLGVDLLIHDATGATLVECKAKRLNLRARYQLDDKALYSEIDILAKYIVQNYKNLEDIVNGHTEWLPSGRSLFPIVVTLINWNLFAPNVHERLEESVLKLLDNANISRNVVDLHPYTVMSVEEYELAFQLMTLVGVKEFFSKRANEHQKGWMVMPFIYTNFPEELKACRKDYLNHVLRDVQEGMARKM